MRAKKIAGIYKIENPEGKIYIGASRDIASRRRKHKELSKKIKRPLYDSYLKFGIDSHKFEILYEFKNEFSAEEMKKMELFYITEYQKTHTLLNVAIPFGRPRDPNKLRRIKVNGVWMQTPEIIEKIKKAMKGNQHFLGRKHTQATKDKLSAYRKSLKKTQG